MTESGLDWCVPGGSRGYVTTRTITWEIGGPGSLWSLVIPAGREFESSVPRLARWFLSPADPRFLRAALVHDHLLEAGFRPFFAAGEWLSAARDDGAPPRFALIAALAVAAVTVARRGRSSPRARLTLPRL